MLPIKEPLYRLKVIKDHDYAPGIPFSKGDIINVYGIYTDKMGFGRSLQTHNGVGYITVSEPLALKITKNLTNK